MSPKLVLAIVATLASVMTVLTTMSIPVLADKSSGSNGLEKADQNVEVLEVSRI